MRRAALLAALAVAAWAAPAAAQGPADAGGPLVYVFVIDGLDGDRVDQGRAPFLRSLLDGDGARATYYEESRAIMVAETNPNHTAMATGAFGDRSGIPGNAFAVYDAPSRAACPGEGEAPMETDGQSATCMIAESFFAAARRQPGAAAVTTAGIFGKPKLARLFSSRREVAAPAFDADYLWTPCEEPGDDTPYCRTVPINPVTQYAATDGVVMDEVLRSVREGVPADGAVKRPNLTFVNFPQLDSAGHATGTGAAYDTAIAQADGELRRFAEQQRGLGLWERTVLFVVSDHSMDTTGEKTSLTQRFRTAGIPDGEYLIVQNGGVDMVYLTDRARPDRAAALKRMRDAALAPSLPTLGQVAVDEALYRLPNPADGGAANTLAAVHPGWRIAGERTGDLFVTHRAGGAFTDPANPLAGNHGGPLTSDSTFAVVSGGAQVRQQSLAGVVDPRFADTERNPGQAESVDIAPTAMRLLGRRPPLDSEGRVLEEAFNPGVLPPESALPGPTTQPSGPGCEMSARLRSVSVRPAGRGLRIGFRTAQGTRARVEVFRQSRGRTIIGNRRVARFRPRERSFTWRARGARIGRGVYVVRLRSGGDVRRVAVRRGARRFSVRPRFERAPQCGVLRLFKLERPVFGGRTNRAVDVSFRLRRSARVSAVVRRGGRVVRRYRARPARAGIVHRLRLDSEGLPRGDHRVRLRVAVGGRVVSAVLVARRL